MMHLFLCWFHSDVWDSKNKISRWCDLHDIMHTFLLGGTKSHDSSSLRLQLELNEGPICWRHLQSYSRWWQLVFDTIERLNEDWHFIKLGHVAWHQICIFVFENAASQLPCFFFFLNFFKFFSQMFIRLLGSDWIWIFPYPGNNWQFVFSVKFYPPDPSQLTEDITRYPHLPSTSTVNEKLSQRWSIPYFKQKS